MLSKKYKLPIGSFPRDSKVVYRDEYGSIRTVKNGLGINRIGVTFKAKSFKTAVLRNKLKRAVFNYFRTQTNLFKEGVSYTGFDLLIVLNPPIIGLKPEEINKILENYGKHIQRITL